MDRKPALRAAACSPGQVRAALGINASLTSPHCGRQQFDLGVIRASPWKAFNTVCRPLRGLGTAQYGLFPRPRGLAPGYMLSPAARACDRSSILILHTQYSIPLKPETKALAAPLTRGYP